ncbi:MAG: dodecin family protein [Rhodothermales bacterium]|nr:dodecin family protein [Rhodothermales bacterium]
MELLAEGDSIEEAVADAAKEASKSVRKVRSVYVDGIQAIVKDGGVTKYRVNCKVTFIVD